LFNSLVAPLVFRDLYEYPLALIAACFLQPAAVEPDTGPRARALDAAAPLGVAGLTLVLLHLPFDWLPLVANFPLPYVGPFQVTARTLWLYLAFGLPALASYLWVERPLRFGLCVLAVWLVATVQSELDLRYGGRSVYKDRSFFGVLS